MLRKIVYPKVEALLTRTAGLLHKRGFSPNQLTLTGLALNFLAGWVYASGHLFLGALVVLVAALGDLLDGPLARMSGRVTKFGGFLDSTVDRYSDFFLFGGLAIHFAEQGEMGWLVMTLGIIMGSFVTSYAKARAENLIPACNVGFLERAERVILLALATLIAPLFNLLFWILFVGTNATAIQRILFTQKALSDSSTK